MMPVLFPLGNYFFIGPRYFQQLDTFVAGTLVVFGLYWCSIITLTVVVRRVIARFPDVRQTHARLWVMLLAVAVCTVVLAIVDVWVYSLVPATGVRFTWQTVQAIWVLGGVFDVLLCTILGLFYTFEQWKQNATEAERLQQAVLQQQFDALKGQVNPHFLFNSLSSISALIGEDNALAERVVDDLAKVYRYMLQAGNRPLVPLGEELAFVGTYAQLLRVRYGAAIRIDLPADPAPAACVPPLCLQTLVDNALEHNSMSASRPLVIQVEPVAGPSVRVSNTRQRKSRVIVTTQHSLVNLTAKYRHLTDRPVQIEECTNTFSVTLPLLETPHDSVR
ncbi:Sensor protein lytS [Fibrella aestuarina BUZ 2]|uniref:Sensor protein lytS n=2 Tax=Fibrella TaxID=861914 RepID=I0KG62_9BACT|nr:Sensor protein lytS [Fibrella aestuarina BUZ 2]